MTKTNQCSRAILRTGASALLWLSCSSYAVQVCELNGQWVNTANGSTTAGKTGLIRCRDGEGGPVVREQELQNGVFMGVVRYFRDGALEREYSVNEQGNRDGRSREFAVKSGTNQLVREETLRNSTTVGIARTWYESGHLKRVAFHKDDGRSEAVAEFTADGKLTDLTCAGRAQLAPHADDAAWCGHNSSKPVAVTLYSGNGQVKGTLTHERGERRYTEWLWGNGKPREQIESTKEGRTERTFSQEGVKRREVQWVKHGSGADARQSMAVDREYHENATLVRERQFTPTERGAELQLEQRWYLNGQPREKMEPVTLDGKAGQRDTRYHDNGQIAFDGGYLSGDRSNGSGRTASGVHKTFDANARLRSERYYDARGRVARERELDESGTVTRDDELFEDGSRKAHAR